MIHEEHLDTPLPIIHAVWVGSKLGPLASACLRSFLAAGHRLILHVYEKPTDSPDGIELADANEIIPAKEIFFHRKSGSPAIFADMFRYELLSKGADVYVDCDVYCIKPIQKKDYIFGMEDDFLAAIGVLALPPQSETLIALRAIFRGPGFIPPWYSRRRQRRLKIRRFLGLSRHARDMEWGVTGPQALTYYARKFGKLSEAMPPDVFYPIDHRRINLLLDSNLNISDLITPRTKCIHIYGESIRRKGISDINKSSPLGKLLSA